MRRLLSGPIRLQSGEGMPSLEPQHTQEDHGVFHDSLVQIAICWIPVARGVRHRRSLGHPAIDLLQQSNHGLQEQNQRVAFLCCAKHLQLAVAIRTNASVTSLAGEMWHEEESGKPLTASLRDSRKPTYSWISFDFKNALKSS